MDDPRIDIVFNDAALAVPAGCTVAQLLDREGLAGRRVAVEVNRQIVPRSAHVTHALVAGDKVEVVHALGGG
ncbi:MAG TPA: sulfur carrier protein ThiS [Xanthomonadaceae bacterium]|nr:sulfur carrier protein ThiS [Xanthomonadaceae bacterium]